MSDGVATLFAGTACRKHPTSLRYVSTGRCKECEDAHPSKPVPAAKTKEEIQAWERARRGLPRPTRREPERCECCGKKSKFTLHLDHCHETGVFRGWLCNKCNTGVGLLGDTIEGVQLALRYLKNKRRAVETRSYRAQKKHSDLQLAESYG